MVLPRGLKRGAFVELDERDIWALTSAVNRSESRTDPRGGSGSQNVSPNPGDAEQVRERRGPRRGDRSRGGRGRSRTSGTASDGIYRQEVAPGAGEDVELDPHELQPPDNGYGAPHTSNIAGNRQRSGNARGPGGSNLGSDNRYSKPPGFGPNPGANQRGNTGGQGQKRRDDRGERNDKSGGAAQPDPMKTSFGYIGADTFTRQRQAQGQGQQRRGNSGTVGPGNGQRRGTGDRGRSGGNGNRGGGNR